MKNEEQATPEEEENWNRLLGAARKSGGTTPDIDAEAPPDSLTSRIPKWREAVLEMARALLWKRWSWIVALGALLLLFAVWLYFRTAGSGPIIEPPNIVP